MLASDDGFNCPAIWPDLNVDIGTGQQIAIPLRFSVRPSADATMITSLWSVMYSRGETKVLPNLRPRCSSSSGPRPLVLGNEHHQKGTGSRTERRFGDRRYRRQNNQGGRPVNESDSDERSRCSQV